MDDQQISGVILLVEDEPLVRLVVADALVDEGFQVIEAASAQEALTVLKAGVEVDVLLSDVEMPPGATGYDLAWQIHENWPLVEILITSGREWPREGLLPPGARFIAKPSRNATLIAHVVSATRKAQAARAQRDSQAQSDEAIDDAQGTVPQIA